MNSFGNRHDEIRNNRTPPARFRTIAFLVFLSLVSSSCFHRVWSGPYSPPAGTAGSGAVPASSTDFIAWATGWVEPVAWGLDLSEQWKTPEHALGPAFASDAEKVVSLGRGGSLTLSFSAGIRNGPGPDFAVFENSFDGVFLELAFVEVSSDGESFHRFPTASLTPDLVGAFGSIDATDIDGFAGKYRVGYGTPFDLQVFASHATGVMLDLDRVIYVRVTDVVGDGSILDSEGRPVYDPYPTIGSAGFDLSGIGVIHPSNLPAAFPLQTNPGWRWSEWLGYIFPATESWLYHSSLAWLYFHSLNGESFWVYHPLMQEWLFTGAGYYPYFYRSSAAQWLWYLPDSSHPQWFRIVGTENWIRVE